MKKISSEFAVSVILIVAGTFAYIFWLGAMNIPTVSAPAVPIRNESAVLDAQEKEEKKWKVFRNDSEGYEFSLPENWKMRDESGVFVAEGEEEKISVVIEEGEKVYSPEELLAQALEADGDAEVEPLAEGKGVKIEKKEAEVLNQTAKLIQGEDVVTLTYHSRTGEQSVEFFNKILPTFKAVN